MKKIITALISSGLIALCLAGCNSQLSVPEITIPAAEYKTDSGESDAEAPDYSQEDCWLLVTDSGYHQGCRYVLHLLDGVR